MRRQRIDQTTLGAGEWLAPAGGGACGHGRRLGFALWAAVAGLGFCAAPLGAAEIELRSDFRSDGGLVLLGDIATITASDPAETKRLAALDVTAAPPAGQRKYLRARELQDLLAARGVNWRQHRLSGASQITILGALDRPTAPSTPAKTPRAPVAPAINPRLATDAATKLLLGYVQERAASDVEFQIKFELSGEQAQFIASAGEDLEVTGGKDPWTGPQQFQLTATVGGELKQTTVRTTVTAPPTLVVAERSLPRGAVIREGDVRLQAGATPKGDLHPFHSIDEVIGKEAPRGLVEGQILDDHAVRPPLLVHRGEIVTVFARCGGVQVRTTARSREDGSHNDLVPVETLSDRNPYFARVIGVQEVEVYAHALTAPGDEGASREAALAVARRSPPVAPTPPRSPTSEFAEEDPRTTSTPKIQRVGATAPATPARSRLDAAATGSVMSQVPLAGPNVGIKSVTMPRSQIRKPNAGGGAGGDE